MNLSSLAAKYDLDEIDKQLGNTFWSPVDIACVNDWILRAAAFKGEFHWHSHKDDEFFLVHKGAIVIDTARGSIALSAGEGAVIPKGLQHRPRAKRRALVLMFEPKQLTSTGD